MKFVTIFVWIFTICSFFSWSQSSPVTPPNTQYHESCQDDHCPIMSYLKSSNLRSGMKPYEIYSNCPLVPIFMTDEGLMLMPNFLEVTNDGDCGSKVHGYVEVHLEDLRRFTSANDFSVKTNCGDIKFTVEDDFTIKGLPRYIRVQFFGENDCKFDMKH